MALLVFREAAPSPLEKKPPQTVITKPETRETNAFVSKTAESPFYRIGFF